MLFQHTMSALDQLMTAASSEAGSIVATQISHDASSKVEKRFAELEKRRAKALKDAKGTAGWWKFFVVCTRDSDTDVMTAVNLFCTLCDTTLSASNESRIAYSHLKGAACVLAGTYRQSHH